MKNILKITLLALFMTSLSYALENKDLGKLSFKSSDNPKAQECFERGMLWLHSFEYHKALISFQEAEKLDPNDAMAYWGVAMTYNHPIWNEQDLLGGKKALAILDAKVNLKNLSPKESGLINAIHLLYGKGNKLTRDVAYADAMHELYKSYPTDDEIATFYALSLLGKTEKMRDFATYMQAASVLEEVFARNPLHPGAAHYLIHSYDDAVHAPLGLRPAKVYAKIAPAASHALHMPSHIFLALGMWDEVISSNQAAWQAGAKRRAYCETHDCNTPYQLNELGDDLHALQWLMYGYLQKHQYQEAYQATLIAKKFADSQPNNRTKWYYALMRAAYLTESDDWSADLKPLDLQGMALSVRANDFYANGMLALKKGENPQKIETMIASFAKTIPLSAPITQTQTSYYTAITPSGISIAKMAVLELKAQVKTKEGKITEAISLLREATKLEDAMPLSYGPPFPVKPPHELLAEMFMHNKQYLAAKQEYQLSLKHAPARTLSEAGLNKMNLMQKSNL